MERVRVMIIRYVASIMLNWGRTFGEQMKSRAQMKFDAAAKIQKNSSIASRHD